MKYLSVLVLVAIIAPSSVFSEQEIPLNALEYGFTIGDPYGKLHIQFFLDLQCPDSRESFRTFKDVFKIIDLTQQKIKFTYQFVPLQFHYYAFKVQQGFFYVWAKAGSTAAYNYIDFVFQNQEKFSEEAMYNYTLDAFLNQFSALIASTFKLNQQDLRKELNSGSDTDYVARYHWKYAVGVHGISGAPIFNANSVRIDAAQNYSAIDWINFFKKYRS